MTSRFKCSVSITFLVATLSACTAMGGLGKLFSEPQDRVDWRWKKRVHYATTPHTGSKVYLSVVDPTSSDVDEGLEQALRERLTADYDLELTKDTASADYATYVYVRYFNTNPDPNSDELLKHTPAGGNQRWIDETGVQIDSPRSPEEIPPRGEGPQFDLMIDVAVGEKLDDGFHLRSARLLGRAQGNREEALWLFRAGRKLPEPTVKTDGTIVPPSAPGVDHLARVLAKGLFQVNRIPEEIIDPPSPPAGPQHFFDWRKPIQPAYSTNPGAGDAVFLCIEDLEEDGDLFNGLREGLITRFREWGLKLVEKPEDAKYACYVYVRYFNGSTDESGSSMVAAAGATVTGGRVGWLDGSNVLSDIQVTEMPPKESKKGWGLLIDFAVGEATEGDVILRTGRLFACIPEVNREEALWLVRRGTLPPPQPEVPEGQPQPAPYRPNPPTKLVDTLGESIFPVRGGP